MSTFVLPAPGALLSSRYRLGECIGRGGMADVFRARDEVLHRDVAVKVFRFDAPTPQDRQRVDSEIHTLASLRHPGLLTVLDAGTMGEDGLASPFLVMELITGPTLAQQLASSGPLSPAATALIGAELTATLVYVHRQGVVHRDIKPANVLLDAATTTPGSPSTKLADFGLARLLDGARLTMDGTTMGTANYLSPEQARCEDVGPASDVYSVGLVLLECLTGRAAYPGVGVEAAVARLHRQPAIPTWFGPAWTRLLTDMTMPDPADRPTALEVCERLRALIASSAATTVTNAPAVLTDTGDTALFAPLPAPQRRRIAARYLVAAAACAVVVLAIVLAAIASSHTSSRAPAAPTYPTVPGPIGRDLQQLQGAVG